MKTRVIMDASAMERAITRITYEILERNKGTEGVCLVGIFSRGAVLAKRISAKIQSLEHVTVPCGALDITPYRDDKKESDLLEKTKIDFDINGMRVVIVDDVICTGRTTRAAIDALITRGRPDCIQLAALVDRGHRELPIRADYVGKNIPTALEEIVQVRVKELDGEDRIVLLKKQG